MIKRIFNQLTTRLGNKRDELELFTGPICPKIQKQLDKYIELSNNCFISANAGAGVYQVESSGRDYIVELLKKCLQLSEVEFDRHTMPSCNCLHEAREN